MNVLNPFCRKLNPCVPHLLASLICVFGILKASPATSQTNSLDFRPLSEARKDLRAPKYTAEQRQLVVDQASMFIEKMYVHRALKIKEFGPSADAVSRLQNLQEKAAAMSDDEFHRGMQRIFLDLHDHHTNYNTPLPLRCSYITTPMIFTDVMEDNKLRILYSGVSRLFKTQTGEFQKATLFDELVAVNGTPIDQYIDVIKNNSAGANEDAMITYGLMNMTIRSLSTHPVPEPDSMTYTLKGNSGTYDVKVDYFAIVNEAGCIASFKGSKFAKKSGTQQNLSQPLDMENPQNEIWKRLVLPQKNKSYASDPLSEVAAFADVKTSEGVVTYLKVNSFMPTNSSVESVIHRLRETLTLRQKDSIGLLIDLRGNGGGAVKLAEEMTQLFTPESIRPIPVRMIPNDLNREMFLRSNQNIENGWSMDVKEALQSGRPFTSPRVLTTEREANRLGQVWFKPVVVLTDATCYSACDLFAASMQDHKAATILGVHKSTGAGGANVMEYEAFRTIFGKNRSNNPFKELPGHQSMRVSWRQSLRPTNFGYAVIENTGVRPDKYVQKKKEDVTTILSKRLMILAVTEFKKLNESRSGSITLNSNVRMNNGAPAVWKESTEGIDTLQVRYNGKLLKSLSVAKTDGEAKISLPDISGSWEHKRFELVGLRKGQKIARVIREIFWRGESIVVPESGFTEDLTSTPERLKAFVVQGTSEDLWQVAPGKSGVLRVGPGPNYNPSIVTEAFLPLDVSSVDGDVYLIVNFKLLSENGMDTFSIMSRDTETGVTNYLYTLDGVFSLNQPAMLPLPNNGRNIEVVFAFESDENWNMKGPEISEITISTGFRGGDGKTVAARQGH